MQIAYAYDDAYADRKITLLISRLHEWLAVTGTCT
jgi:hypothetical protein